MCRAAQSKVNPGSAMSYEHYLVYSKTMFLVRCGTNDLQVQSRPAAPECMKEAHRNIY